MLYSGQSFGLLNEVSSHLSVTVTFPISTKQNPRMDNSAVLPRPTCANEGSFLVPSSNSKHTTRGCALQVTVLVLLKQNGENRAQPAEIKISCTSCLGCHVLFQMDSFRERAEPSADNERHGKRHKSGAQLQIKRIPKGPSKFFLTTLTRRVN